MLEETVITICPTRNRPHLAKRMWDSWQETRRGNALMIFYVAQDDPCLSEYIELFGVRDNTRLLIGERLGIVKVYNKIATEVYSGYKYYQQVNDDHIYRTDGWDIKMKKFLLDQGGWGVVAPLDLFNTNWYRFCHPSAEMICGDLVRCLGYIFYPELEHLGADEFLKCLGLKIKRLWLCKEVTIEHCHAFRETKGERTPFDANYELAYSRDSKAYKNKVLKMYRDVLLDRDIKKIEECMSRKEV